MSNFEVDERASAWSTHEPSSAANSDELRVTHAALVWHSRDTVNLYKLKLVNDQTADA